MPIIAPSSFHPHPLLRGPHLQTIVASFLRRNRNLPYKRERIDTPDGDFLDPDWLRGGSRRLAILSHGLEGSSRRPYILGMAGTLRRAGWDVLAWNFRGCSGEMNRTRRWYHSGETEDLRLLIDRALQSAEYDALALVGFSLGGNMTLKYLGEEGAAIDRRIVGAATFSVPCDLASSSKRLAAPSNRLYMRRFLRSLAIKVREKMARMPGAISDEGLAGMTTFQEFDDRYTAPLHGFRDAEDYWARSSSRPFLGAITVPTLLVNAQDDPFLAPPCFPTEEAERSGFLYLEMPRHGGHVGFIGGSRRERFWMEIRTVAFLEGIVRRTP